jgi:ubiquinol-cytochrome c reductase cytochrome c1 subunit
MTMRNALLLGLVLGAAVSTAAFAEEATNLPPKDAPFSFEGPLGHYDRGALQRGLQVYKEVCSACHSLNRVAFHTLDEEGGPSFSEAEMKALAAGYQIDADPNDQGEIFDDKGVRLKRPGTPSDHFPAPFANENAARASNNGALPPDLSLIVKARPGGAQYIYSILTGFGQSPPHDVVVATGMNYNPYFPGKQIAMPPPLTDSQVTYNDGTKATVDQEAQDVVTFLAWASEPKMEERKHLGFGVLIFLLALSGLLYLSYRRVWKDAH